MNKNPIVTQYVEALSNPCDRFRSLGEVVPERDAYGDLLLWAGGDAVVFKVRVGTDPTPYALKCYTRMPSQAEQRYEWVSRRDEPYWVAARYCPQEIALFDAQEGCDLYPVTLMEWVEGDSLAEAVASCCDREDREGLQHLTDAFVEMAIGLLHAPFAHGDLKQDNLRVTPKGELRLIDYDGLFLPEFAGLSAPLVGSPAYQHPLRTLQTFDRSIDDYPIAVIVLSLYALLEDPSWFRLYHDGENLIFDAAEIQQGRSPLFCRVAEEWRHRAPALWNLARRMKAPSYAIEGLVDLLQALHPTHSSVPIPTEIADDRDPRLALFRQEGLWGYFDLTRRVEVLPPIYTEAMPFSEGLAVVCMDRVWQMIDAQGVCRVDCAAYSRVEPLREGRALVCREGRYGFVDASGTLVIPLEYDFACGFREQRAVVRRGTYFGYVDLRGREVIPLQFSHARSFRHGRAQVEQEGDSFEISPSGSRLTPPKYTFAKQIDKPLLNLKK
ncbi:MAG: WG repeat-containing protein [Alistipes sp.]|nr:WG repeat-containing protein [Alistipes sp.]